jgi:anaerobic selenocysteine-containing dehydrogenase
MKLDRRAFIEIVVGASLGAGGGILLSPVNWKIMDDVAIWTQNWPWTPVPEIGEATHENTICNLCPGGCGVTVRKVGNRVVKIEGREAYPVNDGGICPLGAAGLQLLYGPWRVPSAVRPAGKPGSGAWERISWDRAIGQVTEKLSALRKNGKSHTVACVVSSDRGTVPQLFARFMKAYGSPNFIRTASAEDTNELAVKVAQGKDGSIGYDLENADFILSFGCGLIEGWGSPVRVIQAHSAWRSGKKTTRVVQIEPRLSNTAAKADKWYPINPGTEATLALGLAHVIIRESLYDKSSVNTQTSGFGKWRQNVLWLFGAVARGRRQAVCMNAWRFRASMPWWEISISPAVCRSDRRWQRKDGPPFLKMPLPGRATARLDWTAPAQKITQ